MLMMYSINIRQLVIVDCDSVPLLWICTAGSLRLLVAGDLCLCCP